LVDALGLDPVLLAWSECPSARIAMREVNGRIELDAHPAIFAAPSDEPLAATPGCEVPEDTVGIDWSEPPMGQHEIAAIASSPDGCHIIDLATEEFVVCLPLHELPFAVGESVSVMSWSAAGSYPESAAGGGNGIAIYGQETTIWAVRGSVLARPSEDGFFVPERDFQASFSALSACNVHHDECDNVVEAVGVTITGSGVDGLAGGGAGDALPLGITGGTLHIVRAQAMPIYDTACSPFVTSHNYFESVLVLPTNGSQP
jgi:hypothetical protein